MSAFAYNNKTKHKVADEFASERTIPCGEEGVRLSARILTPKDISKTIIIARGGDTRDETLLRNLTQALLARGYQIVEVDLVRDQEVTDRLVSYDIPLLARRVADVQRWAERQGMGCPSLILGTGNAVAAALWLSTQRHAKVDAVISIHGRPHLAEPSLGSVRLPTLLLVHGDDARALHMNRMAAGRLGELCELHELDSGEQRLIADILGWIDKHSTRVRSRKTLLRTGTSAFIPALSLLRSLISIGVFFAIEILRNPKL